MRVIENSTLISGGEKEILGRQKTAKRRKTATVIRLSDYRSSTPICTKPLVYYISTNNDLKNKLEKISSLDLLSIQSIPDLHSALTLRVPELVIIESDLKWLSPLNILQEIERHHDAPTVLFCRDKRGLKQQALIRDMYKNGLYDVLFAPLNVEEISASLHLVLRLAENVQLGH